MKTLAIVLEGGLVQAVVSDEEIPDLQLLVIDYDVEEAEDDELVNVIYYRGQSAKAHAYLTSPGKAGIDIQYVLKQLEDSRGS